MMSLAYYGLSFNPFDKQMIQEKDRFLSHDMTEMTQRLDYLKDARGISSPHVPAWENPSACAVSPKV